ncbi:hypothetical protein BC628DRAFT_964926 [Trametes gibbosa]|nr:hypothetical protein BC628DRAFT_964926 [Trametes gibbosa]
MLCVRAWKLHVERGGEARRATGKLQRDGCRKIPRTLPAQLFIHVSSIPMAMENTVSAVAAFQLCKSIFANQSSNDWTSLPGSSMKPGSLLKEGIHVQMTDSATARPPKEAHTGRLVPSAAAMTPTSPRARGGEAYRRLPGSRRVPGQAEERARASRSPYSPRRRARSQKGEYACECGLRADGRMMPCGEGECGQARGEPGEVSRTLEGSLSLQVGL